MDNEVIIQQFQEIEQKVEKLIARCRSLESENSQFIGEIERLEGEIQAKVETEQQQKHLIRSKIDGLLLKLEGAIETG